MKRISPAAGYGQQIRPRAFTLIEIMAVLAIIGMLTALTVAAVQMAREAGRRLQGASNLRQFGLALANYATALGSFPLGYGGQ